MPRISPRLAAIAAAPLLTLALGAAACGSGDEGGSWSAQALGERSGGDAPQVQILNSQLGSGPARVAIAIFNSDGALVHDAREPRLRLYTLDGDEGKAMGEEQVLTPVTLRERFDHKHPDGASHLHQDPVATVYVANVSLDREEWWGAELSATVGDRRYEDLRTRFFVAARTLEPPVGEPAPRSTQRVLRDVADITDIDSSRPPLPQFHQLTVKEAAESGKPTVVAFATPAFCQTRFCGPIVDAVLKPLADQYGDRVQFVHIEPYRLDQARAGKLVPIPELEQWGLTTEPWVFVLDAGGRVAAKFEGITSQDEVGAAVERVVARR